MTEAKRKGARTIKDIPKNILEQLNRGEIETANLVEYLAIDRKALLKNLLTQCGRTHYLQPVLGHIDKLEKQTTITVAEAIGAGLSEQILIHKDNGFLTAISTHTSDFVRCWAAEAVGRNTTLTIRQMLRNIKPFAADKHFGVRESAWSAVRNSIIQNLRESIAVLSTWAKDRDENIRRFASEATRPRGVWCEHITELKQNPELAVSILEPLKSDAAKYVRDSVGNWLNDASKTQPEFVRELCARWEKESGTKETGYIVKKALRTIDK
ncbi:MAG: DNA alkylation repair protein [Treponema sp.]|nr:DNA alkylation repair protein [Treponema sp.]